MGRITLGERRGECSLLSQLKSRRDNEPKIKFENKCFGVATIVYFGKTTEKLKKDKTRSAKNQILGPRVDYGWGRY